MALAYVRLASITLDHFANVDHGKLRLLSTDKIAAPSVLGLFGENGSGKTTLMRVLTLLKALLIEKPLDDAWGNFINVDSETAQLQVEFLGYPDVGRLPSIRVFYETALQRKKVVEGWIESLETAEKTEGLAIQSEKLWTEPLEGKVRTTALMPVLKVDTSVQPTLLEPVALQERLFGEKSTIKNDLRVGQRLAAARRTSFLFSASLEEVLRQRSEENTEVPNCCGDLLQLLRRLKHFGRSELFVMESSENSWGSRNTLPLLMAEDCERASGGYRLLPLSMTKPFATVPKRMAEIRKSIARLNTVLEQWVAGLSLGLAVLGSELGADGEKRERAQLVAHRDHRDIPLKDESDGIRKMLAVLPLLVAVYNHRSMTVAADDLDSGVFEPLLGTVVRMQAQGSRGQLIFTSHNLRTLEVLDSSCTAFTTADPLNRYVRLSAEAETGNLRDAYYRRLILSTQETLQLGRLMDTGRLALAMREAGPPQDSVDCSTRSMV